MLNYLKSWNFMRFLRLAAGLAIAVQGVIQKDWTFITLGALFALLPVFNIGCCGSSCRNTPGSRCNSNDGECRR